MLHEKILADYQSLQALKKQLLAAKSKLDTYQDLPANSSLAELKKQAVKNEIVDLFFLLNLEFNKNFVFF